MTSTNKPKLWTAHTGKLLRKKNGERYEYDYMSLDKKGHVLKKNQKVLCVRNGQSIRVHDMSRNVHHDMHMLQLAIVLEMARETELLPKNKYGNVKFKDYVA